MRLRIIKNGIIMALVTGGLLIPEVTHAEGSRAINKKIGAISMINPVDEWTTGSVVNAGEITTNNTGFIDVSPTAKLFKNQNKTMQTASKLNFTKLHMINSFDGWAIANQLLWITHNGGISWRNVSPASFPRDGNTLTQSINAKTAWVIVEPPFQYPKMPLPSSLYITNDGGLKWDKKELSADQPVYYPGNLDVLSEKSAWLTAYVRFPDTMQTPPLQLLEWKRGKFNEIASMSSDQHWKWIQFINDQTGFMASNTLYQTRNGGKNWSIVKLPGLSQYQENIAYPFAPFFFHRQYGILVATISQVVIRGERNTLYFSTNGGLNWIKKGRFPIQSFNFGVYFLNRQYGWAWNPENGYLYHTANRGQSWVKEFTNLSFKNISNLQFVSIHIGYAIEINKEGVGQLIKTTTEGVIWRLAK